MTSLAEGTDRHSITTDRIYVRSTGDAVYCLSVPFCPFLDECNVNIAFRECDRDRFSEKFELFDDSETDDDMFL